MRIVRPGIPALVVFFLLALAISAEGNERTYMANYDLIITNPNDKGASYHVQQSGIHISPQLQFHGDQLGEMDYFFSISDLEDNKGKMTVEVYQFETLKKDSDVISEIIAEVEFTLASPARLEVKNEKFGIDLAFSIDQE